MALADIVYLLVPRHHWVHMNTQAFYASRSKDVTELVVVFSWLVLFRPANLRQGNWVRVGNGAIYNIFCSMITNMMLVEICAIFSLFIIHRYTAKFALNQLVCMSLLVIFVGLCKIWQPRTFNLGTNCHSQSTRRTKEFHAAPQNCDTIWILRAFIIRQLTWLAGGSQASWAWFRCVQL